MTAAAPASLPPAGLPGLDPAWSQLVSAPSADGATRTWHVLDTGAQLAAAGRPVVGTVLAVHGNPTWSYLWRSVAARLTAGEGPAWRLLAVDQLEMGWSERTGRFRTLAERVADLGLLTDALAIEGPVVTLGHDWGGVVSLGWAVDHPALLAGVALTNTAVHQSRDEPIPAALRLALAPAVLPLGTSTTTAFLDTTLAIAHPPLETAVRRAFRAPYRTAERRLGIEGFVRDIPVDERHGSAAELDRIVEGVRRLDVTALMLWGPRDPVFQERYLADLEERLPQARVHRFEGAGHLLPEDVDVAGTVADWLPTLDEPRDGGTDDAGRGAASFVPLWAEVDRRAGDAALALAEPGRGRRVSWRTLADRTRRIAAGLTAVGTRRGDRVALLVPPGADLTAVLYACLRIGAVVVVADAGLGLPGLTRAVRGARPDLVIGVPRALAAARTLGWPGVRISTTALPSAVRRALGVRHTLGELAVLGDGRALPPEPGPDDLAGVLFTSGSTGPAKGVRYTHRRLAAVRDALRAQYGVGPETGLVAGFAPFALLGPALGCRTAVPDMDVTRPATLTAGALAEAIAAVDADAVFLSPAAMANVVATASGRRFDGVRLLLSAGAPLPPPLLEAAAAIAPNAAVHTPYGMTECLLVTDIDLEGIRAAGDGPGVCVGRPVAGVQVRVRPLDPLGRPSGEPTTDADVLGEIEVRAPHMLAGYDRLARTDRAARTADGRHRTGDVGRFDASGRLHVEGRLPHVIAAPDGVLTPVAVERAAETAGVGRAAAVGVGPSGTQQLVVVAEGHPAGLAPAALAAAVRAAVPHPVAAVLATPALPTDVRHNSKIDRARLAAWATRVLAGGRIGAP
ncbi:MAG: alpha/beta fold hydrolase [Amnibacterium sp.]